MSDRDTINVWDPVAGHAVDVPSHPVGSEPTAHMWADMSDREREARFGDDDPPGEELPVLIGRKMRTDPVEGEHGSYTEIVEEDCPACGYDRADHSRHTFAGVYSVTCRACGTTIQQG